MKLHAAVWLILLCLAFSPAGAQEIYEVVDEHGNVTYTDQKPDDDAEPIDLPELNVLESDEEAVPLEGSEALPEEILEDGEPRENLGFAITRPEQDSEMPRPAGGLMVRMDIGIDIPPTAQIVLYLNGQAQEPVRSLQTSLPPPQPGEYQMRAELQTPGGRVLASTDAVSFRILESVAADPSGQ